jgi:Xaa-Pro aminopeptidase
VAVPPQPIAGRLARVRAALRAAGVDALVVGASSDYRYLTGLRPPIPTRLCLLVVPAEGDPAIVAPALEAPADSPFEVLAWSDGEDPVPLALGLLRAAAHGTIAVSGRTWSRYVLPLQGGLPGARFRDAAPLLDPLRAAKDEAEQAALRAAGAAVDATIAALPEVAFAGRTEAAVARDLADLLLTCGHDEIHDVIVGGGPNGALPHGHPGDRRFAAGDAVVVDLGGELDGYVSDITRAVVVGEPSARFGEVHAAVDAAHHAARAAATPGASAGAVDAAARAVLVEAGLGDVFIHRTGHGIGLDTHEAPSIGPGADDVLAPGTAFTIEPGAYLAGEFGVRIEDAVIMGADGVEPLTRASHAPIVVPA